MSVKASTHMQITWEPNGSQTICTRCVVKLIFCKPEANTGDTADSIPFVFVQKTNKFQFAANGMWTIRRQHSTCSQSHSRIHALNCEILKSSYKNCFYNFLLVHNEREIRYQLEKGILDHGNELCRLMVRLELNFN